MTIESEQSDTADRQKYSGTSHRLNDTPQVEIVSKDE